MRRRPPNQVGPHARIAPSLVGAPLESERVAATMDPSERGANSLPTDPSELSTKPRRSSESRLTVALWPALAVRGVSCT